MIQVYKTPKLLKKSYPNLIWGKPNSEGIHLTFDDGPHPEITLWVLEQLQKANAKATFFCVGENIDKFPETAKKTIHQGHRLANHTYNHLKGWDFADNYYIENVTKCKEAIERVDVNQNFKLFRPPYGRIKRSQINELKRQNYDLVMWNLLSWDFDKNVNIKKSIQSLKKAKNGDILVFHDSEKAFPQLKQILPPILDYFCEANLIPIL